MGKLVGRFTRTRPETSQQAQVARSNFYQRESHGSERPKEVQQFSKIADGPLIQQVEQKESKSEE